MFFQYSQLRNVPEIVGLSPLYSEEMFFVFRGMLFYWAVL
jgi:hypothetical protein